MASLSVTNPLISSVNRVTATVANPLNSLSVTASQAPNPGVTWYFSGSSIIRTLSGASARASASATNRLGSCPRGQERASTYGPCEVRVSAIGKSLGIALPIVFGIILLIALISACRRSRISCCSSRPNKGLITPIQYTGRAPATTLARSAPIESPRVGDEEDDLARAIRISLTDPQAVRAARTLARQTRETRRKPETEDPPPPYVTAPESPAYQPR